MPLGDRKPTPTTSATTPIKSGNPRRATPAEARCRGCLRGILSGRCRRRQGALSVARASWCCLIALPRLAAGPLVEFEEVGVFGAGEAGAAGADDREGLPGHLRCFAPVAEGAERFGRKAVAVGNHDYPHGSPPHIRRRGGRRSLG